MMQGTSQPSGFKRALMRPATSIILLVLAIVLLCFSGVGGTLAALTYFSETYTARLEVSQIGVSLMECGAQAEEAQTVAWRNYAGDDRWDEGSSELLTTMLASDEAVKLGKEYKEELFAKNTGQIGQYVRVTLRKYWEDPEAQADDAKVRTVSPELIQLGIPEDNGWLKDEAASTEEREVFYYQTALQPGEETTNLTDTIRIDPAVATKVTQASEVTTGEDGKQYTTLKTTYDYDGMRFCLEATVDAVQDHNAQAGILSAWGAHVQFTDGIMSLV